MVAPIVNIGIQTSKVRFLEHTFQMTFIDSTTLVLQWHVDFIQEFPVSSSWKWAVAGLGVLVGLQITDNIPSYALQIFDYFLTLEPEVSISS
jgi:hypothetical protein